MPAEIKVFTQQNLQGNKIVNVGTPASDTDAATKASAQAQATAAQSAAEATAASLASAAQTAAIAAAALDATTKADAALVSAKAYTDTQITNAGSTNLAAANTYTDTAIANLVNSAPEALNTLSELATALGNNESAVTALVGSIGEVASDLATEVTDRTNGDATLQGLIDGLDGRLDTAESTLATLSGGMTAIFEGTVTGAGTNTSEGFEYTVNHALNKSKILVQVFEGNDVVNVFIRKVNDNSLKIITGASLTSTSLKVVVIG